MNKYFILKKIMNKKCENLFEEASKLDDTQVTLGNITSFIYDNNQTQIIRKNGLLFNESKKIITTA